MRDLPLPRLYKAFRTPPPSRSACAGRGRFGVRQYAPARACSRESELEHFPAGDKVAASCRTPKLRSPCARVIQGLSLSGLQRLVDGFRKVFVKGVDVSAQFLLKLPHGMLRSARQSLLQPRPTDDNQGCRVRLKRVSDLLQVRTRQSFPKVPNQGSRTCADREFPYQIGREEDADQRPHGQATPCPVLRRHLGLVNLHLTGRVFTDNGRIIYADYAVKIKLFHCFIVCVCVVDIRVSRAVNKNRLVHLVCHESSFGLTAN